MDMNNGMFFSFECVNFVSSMCVNILFLFPT